MVHDDRSKLLEAAALTAVLLLSFLLRWWQMGESLWLDELHTAWVVHDGLGQVIARAVIGNQSPLYFYLCWLSTAIFGTSEVALRLPSLLAGMGLIAAVWFVVRRWTGSPLAAVAAALLIGLDPNCIFYAQEARPYAWVQLVGVANIYLFWLVQRVPRRSMRVALVGSGIFLFWLHYTAVLLFAAELAWYGLRRIWYPWGTAYRPRAFCFDALLLIGGCLPAWPHLARIAEHREAWAQFVRQAPLAVVADWFSLALYAAFPLVVLIGARVLRKPPARRGFGGFLKVDRHSEFLLVGCWFLVPVSIGWVLTWLDITRIFFPRYLIVVAAAPMVLAGLCLARLPHRGVQTLLVAVLVAWSVFSGGIVHNWERTGRLLVDRQQDWRAAVGFLRDQDSIGRYPVLLRSGLLEADRLHTPDASPLLEVYCLLPVSGIYDLTQVAPTIIPLTTTQAGELSQKIVQQIDSRGGTWLLINGSPSSREYIDHTARQTLARHGLDVTVVQQENFGTIDAIEWRVRQ